MKGDREVQLDNQPSPTRVLRGSRRNKNKAQTSSMLESTSTTTMALTPNPPGRTVMNDNSNVSTSPIANVTNTENSLDSGYSSQSASSGEQFLMDFNMQTPQVLMTSPVRRRRPSGSNSFKSKHGKNHRYALSKRKSLPVIFEQDDAVFCSPPTTPPPHQKSQRHKIKRRPSSVGDAIIGASYSFPGVRRKGSTMLLERSLKKRISTLADGIVSGGATIVPVVPATGYNGSRQYSEVYSVIPRKTHLPRYGFIIQRNPYTPPPRNRRKLSTITIAGYPHQVHVRRQQSTTSIDDINKRLTQVKLERKDSKVQFSVVEDADATPGDARRGSIANRSDGTASQVAESVRTSDGSESESDSSSSGSDSSSSEWTTDSSDSNDSDSGSESDSDSDTDSSYTTTSSSASTSSDSSSDDSSSDGSSSDDDSSDEDASSSVTSSSMSRSTFYTTDGSDTTSISESTTTDASSVATGFITKSITDELKTNEIESPSKSRASSRTSNKSGISDTSGSTSTSASTSSSSAASTSQSASKESRRLSGLSRSSSRSSFRSSSASPIKSKKDSSVSRRSSRSSSLERPPSRTKSILSDVINSVSPKSSPKVKRRDSKRSNKLRTDEYKGKRKSDSSERKKEKAEKRKSNVHIFKENGGINLKTTPSRASISMVSTPSVIKHNSQENVAGMPPNHMSTTCVIL